MLNIMAKHVFTGVFIPAKIWIAKDLIPQEKMMLAEIKALSEDSGWCFAGNKHFAEWLGCGTSNISNYIQRFQREGMIEVTYNDKKTFAGRRMRVNLEWYHALSTPYIETETPYTGNVPPFSGNEAPYTGAVTERQFKSTSKPNESGGALNESQSLKEEEVKTGMYAPTAALTRVTTSIEAEQKIIEWAASGGIETIKYRYQTAHRMFEEKELPILVAHYVSVYTSTNEGSRANLMRDPVQNFQDGLFKYLTMQNTIDRNNGQRTQPGAAAHQSNSPVPTNIRRL